MRSLGSRPWAWQDRCAVEAALMRTSSPRDTTLVVSQRPLRSAERRGRARARTCVADLCSRPSSVHYRLHLEFAAWACAQRDHTPVRCF